MSGEDLKRVELADWGVMRVAGVDAAKFLQGQLSNDVERLAVGSSLLAGYHNPQGRVIALMRLARNEAGDVLAVMPRELVADVIARLRKFVLRAKAVITDESAAYRVLGLLGAAQADGATWLSVEGDRSRGIGLVPVGSNTGALDSIPQVEQDVWTLRDVQDGVPHVYKATSEAFVAQMVNLDVLGGIAFDKGCYTGQEVIARAHYRGRVKRRMQRFRTTAPAMLARGDSGLMQDGRSYKVVEVARLADGRCEFLAVAPLEAGNTDETDSAVQSPALGVEQLSLPYSLPD